MDLLSVTASVIALVDAANVVIRYASCIKGAKTAIAGLLAEIKDLRNLLETVEQTLVANDEANDEACAINLARILSLCNPQDGPIAQELCRLSQKLHLPDADQDPSRRRVLMQSLTWPLKEADTMKSMDRITRLKKDLELALTMDQSYVRTVIAGVSYSN